MPGDLLLGYYGDDFTGSTDVLEALALNGVPTVLFLEPPAPDDLDAFDDVRAAGIAGTSRRMSPAEMDEELPPAFAALDALDPAVVQYKVCSTFDSSPEVGSIGHAIDLGREQFDAPFVPVVVAAPSLEPRGRYVVFGNLFATAGGETYRLDRHPTMSEHPVTPMTEADLARHLGEQTDRPIGNLELRHVDGKSGAALQREVDAVLEDAEIVVIDGLNHDHQRTAGRLVWERRERADGPLLSASSSGLDYALAAHWRAAGIVEAPEPPDSLAAVERIVVMSGSASPVTDGQIGWALDHDFAGIRLDTAALIDPDAAAEARADAVDAALDALDDGASPLLYAARGPDDPAIERTTGRAREMGLDEGALGRRLGEEQGRITRAILERRDVGRACVAGGDTSGHVAPALDVHALRFAAPVGPGSPLCRARSRAERFDGLEIALKGGQVETTHDAPDYFGVVRDGGDPTTFD